MGGVPSRGVYLPISLRNPSLYLRVFRRQARPGIELGTSRLPVFERRIAQPLVGPRTDNLTSMLYPEFEPGTFGEQPASLVLTSLGGLFFN